MKLFKNIKKSVVFYCKLMQINYCKLYMSSINLRNILQHRLYILHNFANKFCEYLKIIKLLKSRNV